ncbi:Tk-subtilisin [uncultured archaeon]|nr:Tk-subtilisin [uncultured archaeon]
MLKRVKQINNGNKNLLAVAVLPIAIAVIALFALGMVQPLSPTGFAVIDGQQGPAQGIGVSVERLVLPQPSAKYAKAQVGASSIEPANAEFKKSDLQETEKQKGIGTVSGSGGGSGVASTGSRGSAGVSAEANNVVPDATAGEATFAAKPRANVLNDVPLISEFSPEGSVELQKGNSKEFSVKITGVDGNVLSVEWFVDGNKSSSGNAFRFDSADYSEGRHAVKAFAANATGSVSKEWGVQVVLPPQPINPVDKIYPALLSQAKKVKSQSAGPEQKVKVLISVSDRSQFEKVESLIRENNGTVENAFEVGGIIVAMVGQSRLVEIAKETQVASIWPNLKVSATLDNSVPQTGAPSVWDSGYYGGGSRVAVLDTGIDKTHPMLSGKVIMEKNFSDSATVADVYGHGTHVAGIIAGSKEQGGLHNGVAPKAALYNVKVLDDNGEGSYEGIIAGINWATDPDNNPSTDDGAQAINMSLGAPVGYSPSNPQLDPLYRAIKASVNRGVSVVVSSGNCGSAEPDGSCEGYVGVTTPGNSPDAITVGAVDDQNNWAGFSSGQDIEGVGIKPDLVAPGVFIESSYPNGRYKSLRGTSMAAPHVTGAVALLLSADSSLQPNQIKKLLELTATDLGEPGKDTKFGSGLLDLRKIIEPKPVLSKDSFSGAIDESQEYDDSIRITDEGVKKLVIYGVQPTSGIEFSLGKNLLEAAESTDLNFSIKGATIGVGSYDGRIDINTNAGLKSIPVRLQVGTSAKPVVRSLNIPKVVYRGEVSDIVVEAIDDSKVDSVSVQITSPLGVETTLNLVLSADGKWRFLEYAFPKETSDKGNYKVKVLATDDSSNTTVFDSSFDIINAQYSLPEEYIVNEPASIKVSYKNTALQSLDATAVISVYNETGEKIDELLQTKQVLSGEQQEFNITWQPVAIGNYLLAIKLLENGNLVEELDKNAPVLVPDVLAIRGISLGADRIEKGTSQSYSIAVENTSANDFNALIEIDIMRGNLLSDVLVLDNATVLAGQTQNFSLQKQALLSAGEYAAVPKIHFGNRINEGNPVEFGVFTPPVGAIDSIELPEKIYAEKSNLIGVVFSNNGNIPLDTVLYGKIMDGNAVVGSLDFNSMQVSPNSSYAFEADNDFNGFSGDYLLKISGEYEGNFIEVDKNLSVIDDTPPMLSGVSYEPEVKKNGLFTLRLAAQDNSRIGKAMLTVNGTSTEMKETSSFNNTHFFVGPYYGTSLVQDYTFSAEVCDEYSNCASTPTQTFNVVDCTGSNILVVSEEDYFTNLLGQGYCAIQWKKSIGKLPVAEYLGKFDAVIWSEGTISMGIDENEAALLESYVSSGGKLLLEGANIASRHRDDKFMLNVAHAVLTGSPAFKVQSIYGDQRLLEKQGSIIIKRTHPVTKGIEYIDVNNEASPFSDELEAVNGGYSLADWNNGKSAMAIFDDYNVTGAKGVFLPFSFNALEQPKQQNLLENIIGWLLNSSDLDLSVKNIALPEYIVAEASTPITIEIGNSQQGAPVLIYVDNELAGTLVADPEILQTSVSLKQGKHIIKAEINPSYDIIERDYFNNVLEKEVWVAPVQADIMPVAFTYTPQQPSIGEPLIADANILNAGGTTVDANISIYIDGNVVGSQVLNIPFGQQSIASAQWPATSGIHSIRIVAETLGDDANAENNSLGGSIYVCSGPKVIVVADDDAKSFSSEVPDSTPGFEEALKGNGYCVSTWKESQKGVPPIELLNSSDAVVWSSGNYWNTTMDEKDKNLLAQYNGNVLFEGADLAFDSNDSGFLENNLHASFDRDIILDENNSSLVLGDSNLLAGISSIDLNASLSPTPDSLTPFDGQSIADWNNADSAIVVSDTNASKRAFMGFSANAITNKETRNLLASNLVKWLTFKNQAPKIISITSNSPIKEGETIEMDINAVDQDGDQLFYSINSPSFDANGSHLSWATDNNSAGKYIFTATVSDGQLASTIDINVEVIHLNMPPLIQAVTANSPVNEGETLTIDISATDPENDLLTYSINSPNFTVDGNKFTWKTDYNSAGNYNFVITVSDGNLSASADVNASVLNVNRPPVIESVVSNSPVKEGETLAIDVNAFDIDNDLLVYSINSPFFKYDGGRFVWATDYNSAGDYTFTITVSDGNLSSSMDLNVGIVNVNRAPEILSIATNSPVSEGEILTINVNATDSDNDLLSYSISSPNFALEGNQFTWKTDFNSAGEYTFSVTVSDGNLYATEDVNVQVRNVNLSPEILAITSNTPVKEGETLTIDINATDSDNDTLSYSINSPDFNVNGNNLTWITDYNSAGNYTFTVTVSDGNLSASSGINFKVINVNRAPVLSPIQPQNLSAGQLFNLQVTASDPDNDTLTYSVDTNLFDINSETGSISFVPKKADAGKYLIKITASDGNSSDSNVFELEVIVPNEPPVLEISMDRNEFMLFDEAIIKVNATDEDNDRVSFSIDNNKFKFDGNSAFKWSIYDANSFGDYNVTITASDGVNTVQKSVSFRVKIPEAKPPCKDSDGGLNYYEKGTADDRINGIGSRWDDTCRLRSPCKEGDPGYGLFGICAVYSRVDECSGDSCNLQEGYCKNGKATNQPYYCEFGCSNGACNTEPKVQQATKINIIETRIIPSPGPSTAPSPLPTMTPTPAQASPAMTPSPSTQPGPSEPPLPSTIPLPT